MSVIMIGVREFCRIAEEQKFKLGRLLLAIEDCSLEQLKQIVATIKDPNGLFTNLVLLKIKEIKEKRNLKKFLELPKEDQMVFGGVYKGEGFSIKLIPTTEPR